MGEARRRGTRKERVVLAVKKQNDEANRIKAIRAHQPTAKLSPQTVAVLAMAGVAGFCVNDQDKRNGT